MVAIKKDVIRSVIFTLLYIIPFPISTFSSGNFRDYSFFLVVILNFILMLVDPLWFSKKNIKVILFASMFIILGLFTYFIKHASIQNFLFPFMAIYAIHYLKKFKFNFIVLDIVFIFLYIFYYIVYYRQLSNLLFHSYEIDADLFKYSSSNSIAICLNILLYIYIILVFINKPLKKNYIKLLIFSVVNIILIVIQQSRAGILVSIVLFFIIYLQFLKTYFVISKAKYLPLFVISIIIASVFIYQYYDTIISYLNIIGIGADKSILLSYQNESRGTVVDNFFANLNYQNFFIGYTEGYIFGDDLKYTYNIYLDIWNNYTVIGFIVISIIFIRRIFLYKKYFFPIFFIIPFLIYSFVEPRFLPNYWDFSIYLLLFKKL